MNAKITGNRDGLLPNLAAIQRGDGCDRKIWRNWAAGTGWFFGGGGSAAMKRATSSLPLTGVAAGGLPSKTGSIIYGQDRACDVEKAVDGNHAVTVDRLFPRAPAINAAAWCRERCSALTRTAAVWLSTYADDSAARSTAGVSAAVSTFTRGKYQHPMLFFIWEMLTF